MEREELEKEIKRIYNELYDLAIDEREVYGEETRKLLHKAINDLSDARTALINEILESR